MRGRQGVSQDDRARPATRSPAGGARPATRPPLWREAALVVLGYWAYTLVRNQVPQLEHAAVRRAEQLFDLERALGIDIELAVNLAVDRLTWLVVGMNYFYAVAHFAVTIGVLVWLYCTHPHRYRPARSVFLIMNAVALVGFYVYPLAPPRLLPGHGFVDTVVSHDTWGSWASGDIAAASNQYAAMPSMHVAWSLWCAAALVLFARHGWVRVAGALHPVVTVVVIVATANHFLLDAVGGAAVLAAGYAVVRLDRRRRRPPVVHSTVDQPWPARPEPAGPVASPRDDSGGRGDPVVPAARA